MPQSTTGTQVPDNLFGTTKTETGRSSDFSANGETITPGDVVPQGDEDPIPDSLGDDADWDPIRAQGPVPPNSEILTIRYRVCTTVAPTGAFGPVEIIANCEIYQFVETCYTLVERYWVRPGETLLIGRSASDGQAYYVFYEICAGFPPRRRTRIVIVDEGHPFPPQPPPVPPGQEATWVWLPPPEMPFIGDSAGYPVPLPPDPSWFTDVSYVMKPLLPVTIDGCFVRVRWEVVQVLERSKPDPDNHLERIVLDGDPIEVPTGTTLQHDFEIEGCRQRRTASADGALRPMQMAKAALAHPAATGVLALEVDGELRFIPVKHVEMETAIGLKAASKTRAIPRIEGNATLLVMTSGKVVSGGAPYNAEHELAGELFVEVRGTVGALGHPHSGHADRRDPQTQQLARELGAREEVRPDVVFVPSTASATTWEDDR